MATYKPSKELRNLAKEIESELKAFIISEDHVDTGALLKSVKVKFKEDDIQNKIVLNIRAKHYLKYLGPPQDERGDFLTEFRARIAPKVRQAIGNEMKRYTTWVLTGKYIN